MKGLSRNACFLAALCLAAAAVLASPDLLARLFSADGRLGEYVVFRLHLLRGALFLTAAAAAAWGPLPPEDRERALGALGALPGHPAAVFVVFAAGLAFLWTELRVFEWDPASDGVALVGSSRVLRGEVPCRDFFSYLPPLFFYWGALAMRLISPPMEAMRIAASILPKFLAVAAFYRVSRAVLPRAASLGLSVIVFAFLSQNPNLSSLETQYLSLFFCLLTMPPLFALLRGGAPRALLLSGAAAAAAAQLRQDLGFFVLLTNLTGMAIAAAERRASGNAWPFLARCLGWYMVPCAALTLAVAGGMLAAVPLPWLRECYVDGPVAYMKFYSTHGRTALPLGGLWEWLRGGVSAGRAVFLLATRDMASSLGYIGILAGTAALLRRWDRSVALLLAWCVFFMGYPLKGGAFVYIGVLPVALVILALLAREARPSFWRGAAIAALVYYGGVLLFFRPFSLRPEGRWLDLPVGRLPCVETQTAADLEAVIAHLQKAVPPGEKIFVANGILHNSHTFLYFLTQRDSATRYHEMVGGISSTEEAQARMIGEIERAGVRRVVLTHRPADSVGRTPPSDLLRRHLDSRFEEEARFGVFQVLRRKTGGRQQVEGHPLQAAQEDVEKGVAHR